MVSLGNVGMGSTPGGKMKLTDQWHMCVNSGSVDNDNDLSGHTIIGSETSLRKTAIRKLVLGIWDTVWFFPPGSDSHPNATHPGNPYWVAEIGDGGYVSFVDLDEY